MKKNIIFLKTAGKVVGLLAVLLAFGLILAGCNLNKKTCDDENNCSAANNQYYCGRSGCAADTGNRCNCD
ncbi:MAG: hypothetical protein LBK02_10460 [Treponema sp.]|jgi:hypothetical protein|nr:hypothetical protein [Treponema sp.]